MLTVLKIKNLALVDTLIWELGSGLVGVTGETGAGKSIIVGALKLVLGERADRSLLRTGESQFTVEAVFRLPHPEKIDRLLEEAGLDPCEDNELILKRVVSESGDNKQFINCSPATLTVLKRLGQHLVDLHGPHDHQSLLSTDRQLDLLDGFAHSQDLVSDYRKSYASWKDACRALADLRDAEQATSQEIDLLRFQVEEIQEADLKPDEDRELEQLFKVASNSQRLIDSAGEIANRLNEGPAAVLGQLSEIQKLIRELERFDEGTADLVKGFTTAQIELEELARGLDDYLSSLEVNPEEVDRIGDRIDQVEGLKRKYGGSIDAVLEHADEAQRKLELIDGRDSQLEILEEQRHKARVDLEKHGKRLQRARTKAAPKLAAEISRHLSDLGFHQSEFEVTLVPEEASAHGLETVEFQFSPNPGQPLKPLRVIASSGEMSRVMLAVKSALADQDRIPLLVFDEIDANVGGEIAHAVGRKMAKLGELQQVIAITHMPQVASSAHQHFVVTKEVIKGSTRSTLQRVEGQARIAEVARMLGGGGKSAIALAESMLTP